MIALVVLENVTLLVSRADVFLVLYGRGLVMN